jgi:hypothetical protein
MQRGDAELAAVLRRFLERSLEEGFVELTSGNDPLLTLDGVLYLSEEEAQIVQEILDAREECDQ